MATFKISAPTFIKTLYEKDFCDLEDSLFSLFNRLDLNNATGETLTRYAKTAGSTYINIANPELTRAYIRGTIAAKFSKGTIYDIEKAWRLITNSTNSYIVERFPFGIELFTDVNYTDSEASEIKTLLTKALPSNCKIISLTFIDATKARYDIDNYDSKPYAKTI